MTENSMNEKNLESPARPGQENTCRPKVVKDCRLLQVFPRLETVGRPSLGHLLDETFVSDSPIKSVFVIADFGWLERQGRAEE
jgi:hypothetical protein